MIYKTISRLLILCSLFACQLAISHSLKRTGQLPSLHLVVSCQMHFAHLATASVAAPLLPFLAECPETSVSQALLKGFQYKLASRPLADRAGTYIQCSFFLGIYLHLQRITCTISPCRTTDSTNQVQTLCKSLTKRRSQNQQLCLLLPFDIYISSNLTLVCAWLKASQAFLNMPRMHSYHVIKTTHNKPLAETLCFSLAVQPLPAQAQYHSLYVPPAGPSCSIYCSHHIEIYSYV
jgi:hypothetical protein